MNINDMTLGQTKRAVHVELLESFPPSRRHKALQTLQSTALAVYCVIVDCGKEMGQGLL
jgi:hypothetical protein